MPQRAASGNTMVYRPIWNSCVQTAMAWLSKPWLRLLMLSLSR